MFFNIKMVCLHTHIWDFDIVYSMLIINIIDSLHSGQVNQSVRYVHSCQELAILIQMSTNNPSLKSLESSIKPKLGLKEDSRTTDMGCIKSSLPG